MPFGHFIRNIRDQNGHDHHSNGSSRRDNAHARIPHAKFFGDIKKRILIPRNGKTQKKRKQKRDENIEPVRFYLHLCEPFGL